MITNTKTNIKWHNTNQQIKVKNPMLKKDYELNENVINALLNLIGL